MFDNCIDYLLTASQICYSFVSRCSSCSDINFVKVVDPVDAAYIEQTEHVQMNKVNVLNERKRYIHS